MKSRIITNNIAMKSLLLELEIIRNSDCPVLIIGETGTGKEILADYIHANSSRNEKRFVKVSLSSLPDTLFESELFGHEKGAFTGADHARKGYFEAAHQATIYLDDIDDFPLNLQPKLLRVIENKELVHIGNCQPVPVDARIISSSKEELKDLVDKKRFRMDLFYRLSVFRVYIPPLRERKEDIPLLLNHFIDHHRTSDSHIINLKNLNLTPLYDYKWVGNVRELRNFTEKLLLYPEAEIYENFTNIFENFISSNNTIRTHNSEVITAQPDNQDFEKLVSQYEIKLISDALKRSYGNVSLASELINLKPSTLRDKIKKYNIECKEYKV